jgi:thiosulfate/3-mercaptopyruvate sulfurtransferase
MNSNKVLISAKEILSFTSTYKKSSSCFKFIDCSWHMLSTNRNGYTEFLQRTKGRKGRGLYFDLDECSDKQSPYPHMLPTNYKVFEEYMNNMKIISNDDEIILYDCDSAVHSRFRVYFTLKYFNHSNVRVLRESKVSKELEEYMLQVNSSESETETERYRVQLPVRDDLLFKYEQLPFFKTKKNEVVIVVDARSRGRFSGKDKEPRKGLKSGCIPNSVNVPFNELFNNDRGEMKSKEELHSIFSQQAGLTRKDSEIVCSCGSGVTAACLFFALHELLGYENVKLYDGSWTEYALRQGLIE